MSDFDAVSRTLGNLEGKVDALLSQQANIFKQINGQNSEIIEHRGALKLLAIQNRGMKKKMDTDIVPVIDDYKAVKNRGIGAVLGLSMAGGGITAGFVQFFTHLFKNAGHPG